MKLGGVTHDNGLFAGGQLKDAEALGDSGVTDATGFTPSWDATFLQAIDGVIIVAGDSHLSVEAELAQVKLILGISIRDVVTLRGDTRPGKESGHEQYVILCSFDGYC
jgi:hypothetical protein